MASPFLALVPPRIRNDADKPTAQTNENVIKGIKKMFEFPAKNGSAQLTSQFSALMA